jgi:hypothetical protein
MADVMQHVHALADEIGPRPATTDAEQRAATYIDAVFRAHGLEPELQHFEAPRTYSWAYVLYHLLTIAAAVVVGFFSIAIWPAFAVSALVAFFLYMDLDTRFGFSSLMPKGPTQNVIARHLPKTRRGERVRRIVVVAHYDSSRSSFPFSPGVVGNFHLTFTLMKWATFLVPVLILIMGIPAAKATMPWLWYATLAIAAYLLIPLAANIQRETAGRWVDGANDNASGVAAMLGVLSNIVPESDVQPTVTGTFNAVVHGEQAAREADVVPEGALLRYAPSGADTAGGLPDDFVWADTESGPPASEPALGQRMLELDTVQFDEVPPSAARGRGAPARDASTTWADESDEEPLPAGPGPAPVGESKRGGLLGKLRPKKQEDGDVRGWLGVDESFDARKEGGRIGSWDNFEPEDDDDDDWGLKGGWAGDDPIDDPEFAAVEAARIRRRVTDTIDRDLNEKEVWFVATGAEETGTWGMKAFLNEFAEDLHDAFIINIDGAGAGALYWITSEGMARQRRSDRRLTGLARRVSREHEILVKPRAFRGLSTDASPALTRGFKAMSVMALTSEGYPANWHWTTDSTDEIDPEMVQRTIDFVTAMIREA